MGKTRSAIGLTPVDLRPPMHAGAVRRRIDRSLAAAIALLLTCGQAQATTQAGAGSVIVSQYVLGTPNARMIKEVEVVGGYAPDILPDSNGSVLRFQFVRPDSKAVAFAVFSLPSELSGTYASEMGEVDLLYYEQHPNDMEHKLFLVSDWEAVITVTQLSSGNGGNFQVNFDAYVSDFGVDQLADTADDLVRELIGAQVVFFAQGSLSGVSYEDSGDTVYVSGETFIVYDDGCTGSPDSYDDDYGYDSSYYDDDWEGSSCDVDVYDDSDGWDSSDSYDDASCDYDDDSYDYENDYYDDWTYESASTSTDNSSSDSDGDWTGDEYYSMQGMSWTNGIGRFLAKHRRKAGRMAPLALGLVFVFLLKWRTRRLLASREVEGEGRPTSA